MRLKFKTKEDLTKFELIPIGELFRIEGGRDTYYLKISDCKQSNAFNVSDKNIATFNCDKLVYGPIESSLIIYDNNGGNYE